MAEVQHFVKIGLFTVKINDVIKMERGKNALSDSTGLIDDSSVG